MNMYEISILNTILICFPILLNFIDNLLSSNDNKKMNNYKVDISIITSLYLVLKFNTIYSNNISILYLNLPLFIAYINKRFNLSIIISTVIVMFNNTYFNIPIYLGTIEYTIYYILFYYKPFKMKIDLYGILNIIIFNIYLYLKDDSYVIYKNILIGLSFYAIVKIVEIMDKHLKSAISFNKTLQDLEREKQLRMSLFQITHEIKNPITVCKGYLDMFDVNNLDHSKRYVPILKNEISRVLILIEDFLSITKIKIKKDIMDLNMLVEENMINFKPILETKNIRYEFNCLDDELYINGDYNRLNQVIINLIKNSIEACSSNNYIKVYIKPDKKKVNIVVEDNGKGMDKEELEKIKKPFFTTKTSGTGLGLYLCDEIVKAHDGEIKYSSILGKGTRVVVRLPYKKDVIF